MGESLASQVAGLPWHHAIDFGGGIVAPGNTKPDVLKAQAEVYFTSADPRGRTVLDIGCWDGFNAIEAHRRGAARVLATDHFAWSSACWGDRRSFDMARSHLAPEIEVMDIDIPDLSVATVGQFDMVLFLGVFYHLRHPFAVLEQIAPLAADTLIVETHLDALDNERPAMIFYPGRELADDPSNWWGPNVPCVEAMLRDVGFRNVRHTQHPMYATRGIFHARRS